MNLISYMCIALQDHLWSSRDGNSCRGAAKEFERPGLQRDQKKNKGRAHEAERQRKGNNEKVSEGNAHSTISQILRSFLCPGPFCKVNEPIRALLSGYKIFLWEEFFTDHVRGERRLFPQDQPRPVQNMETCKGVVGKLCDTLWITATSR